MKFKVGDTVRIRNDLKEGQKYGFHMANQDMANMGSNLYTIEEISIFSDHITYKLEDSYWAWSEEMLEPADSKTLRMADGTIIGEFAKEGIFAEAKLLDLSVFCNAFPKEEEKMSTKFTFYVTEGYRIDKSNNTRIPTMTTEVLINGKDYQYGGSATCDKTDYEEREGVLNAIANAVCGGNFDREFNKVMKNKAAANKKSRTCTYCGQVFDTVEEKQEHEAWHVERKKARRERYLLRKRAKEIAFEEQAQKMAKEMMKEDK